MTFPPISDVIRRYRWLAYILCGIMCTAILSHSTYRAAQIYVNREHPRTRDSIIDGTIERNGKSVWGPMPVLYLQTWSWMGLITKAEVNCPWYDWHGFLVKANGSADPSTNTSADKERQTSQAVVNMSMLTPNFRTAGPPIGQPDIGMGIHSSPIICVGVHFNDAKKRGIQMVVAQPSQHQEVIVEAQEHLKIPGIQMVAAQPSNHQDVILEAQEQLKIPGDKCVIVNTLVSKMVVPIDGIFWGWPGSIPHTRERYTITFSNQMIFEPGEQWPCDPKYVRFLFTVVSPIVQVVEPISLFDEISKVLTTMGGQLTLISLVFGIFFVKKYPRSDDDRQNAALTLRFLQAKTRAELSSFIAIKPSDDLEQPLGG